MMIGLKRGIVDIMPYHDGWRDLFEWERADLQQKVGHLVADIQHVGSTAVPGLAAKPIIDIAVAIADRAVIPELRQPFRELGYIDRGDQGVDGGYLFVKESLPQVRIVHLHVVSLDDHQWRNYLRFRDRLIADSTLRTTYGELKAHLRQQFAGDRAGYTAAKHQFIHDALKSNPEFEDEDMPRRSWRRDDITGE